MGPPIEVQSSVIETIAELFAFGGDIFWAPRRIKPFKTKPEPVLFIE
jgi:hypothetical protein